MKNPPGAGTYLKAIESIYKRAESGKISREKANELILLNAREAYLQFDENDDNADMIRYVAGKTLDKIEENYQSWPSWKGYSNPHFSSISVGILSLLALVGLSALGRKR